MLGAILGDIVGSVYEFNNTKNYHFNMFTPFSSVTDDSILTVAVAQWAMEDPSFSHRQLEKYLVDYVHAFPSPQGGYGCGFLEWVHHPESVGLFDTSSAEEASDSSDLYAMSEAADKATRSPYNSWGNGSAMRVSAVGWLFDSLQKTERVAGISASITHNHPEGIKGAQATAAAIYMARTGASKEQIRSYITDRYGYQLEYDKDELHGTYTWHSSCQGTVPQAIWAFLESDDFESALRLAVSLGGDSDTLACITGGIAEAYYREIPATFVRKALSLMPERLIQVLKQFRDTYYKENFDQYIAKELDA